jgi:cytochrome P450
VDIQELAESLGRPPDEDTSDPYATLTWLRTTGSVQQVPGPLGSGSVWFVTSYEHARDSLADPRLSFDPRNSATAQPGVNPESYILARDAPEHTRLRESATAAFTPVMVERMRPRIRQICVELIDSFRDRDDVDLVRDYALPIPELVISDFLGIPEGIRLPTGRGTQLSMLIGFLEQSTTGPATRELAAYVERVISHKRTDRRNDLASDLIGALERGLLHDETELSGMIYLLYSTAQLSTAPLIAAAIARLLQQPDRIARLVADRRKWRAALEEALRYDAAVQTTMARYALEDFEMAGKYIKRGDAVVISLAAANRDPAQFVDPDSYRLTERRQPHLGFGYGTHFCLGAPLARLEGEIALEVLFTTLPGLRIPHGDEELTWTLGPMLRCPRAVPAVVPAPPADVQSG